LRDGVQVDDVGAAPEPGEPVPHQNGPALFDQPGAGVGAHLRVRGKLAVAREVLRVPAVIAGDLVI
jgi:hypothetical protein